MFIEKVLIAYHPGLLETWRRAYFRERVEPSPEIISDAEAGIKVLNAAVGMSETLAGMAMIAGSRKVGTKVGIGMVAVGVGLIADAVDNFRQLRQEGVSK